MCFVPLTEEVKPIPCAVTVPPWCLHCTFITRDEGFGPALKGGRDDGAVPVRENVLRVVVDVLPAVGAGLQEGERGEGRQR